MHADLTPLTFIHISTSLQLVPFDTAANLSSNMTPSSLFYLVRKFEQFLELKRGKMKRGPGNEQTPEKDCGMR